MKATDKLEVGDVVQLDPELCKDSFFAGCFMQVTDMKNFGAQGFICMPGKRGEIPGRAYFRANWEQMSRIGKAEWEPKDGGIS
jgi:hypothetical protein